jgi:hypothetical protein
VELYARGKKLSILKVRRIVRENGRNRNLEMIKGWETFN